MKLEIEVVSMNVINGSAQQVACEMTKKEIFWSELEEVVDGIPKEERAWWAREQR